MDERNSLRKQIDPWVFWPTAILSLAFVFPKIGAVWAIALVVLGQSLVALAIDHCGLLGMPKDPITVPRAAGLALVALGVTVIRY